MCRKSSHVPPHEEAFFKLVAHITTDYACGSLSLHRLCSECTFSQLYVFSFTLVCQNALEVGFLKLKFIYNGSTSARLIDIPKRINT
jgi:hypothetical protein